MRQLLITGPAILLLFAGANAFAKPIQLDCQYKGPSGQTFGVQITYQEGANTAFIKLDNGFSATGTLVLTPSSAKVWQKGVIDRSLTYTRYFEIDRVTGELVYEEKHIINLLNRGTCKLMKAPANRIF